MKTNNLGLALGLVTMAMAWAGIPGCGNQVKGEGSESHFVECRSDSDCRDAGAGPHCASGRCTTPTTTRLDSGSETGTPTGPGECTPVVARRYDLARDCYGPKALIPDLCLRETEPNTSGLAEITCLVAPDGTRYATVKGFTQCLEGQDFRADAGVGGGWTVRGDQGLCALQASYPGNVVDSGCMAAISRAHWFRSSLNPTLDFGVGPGNFDPPPDAGRYAGECP